MSESTKKFELSPSVSILIAGVLVAGAIIFVNKQPAAVAGNVPQQETPTANVPAPTAEDFIVGSPTAPIVLIEYSDFQCPFCSMIYPTLKKITAESGGEVAWVMREYPLYQIHPEAIPAATAALCIADQLGKDSYWKFADAIFADQSKMSASYYAQLAKQFGANTDTFTACIKSDKFTSKIDNESLQAQTNGGNGTPFTIVLNTKTGKQYPVSGALPYAQIVAVIEAAKAGK